jgi:hypothetical protein
MDRLTLLDGLLQAGLTEVTGEDLDSLITIAEEWRDYGSAVSDNTMLCPDNYRYGQDVYEQAEWLLERLTDLRHQPPKSLADLTTDLYQQVKEVQRSINALGKTMQQLDRLTKQDLNPRSASHQRSLSETETIQSAATAKTVEITTNGSAFIRG